MVIRVRPTIFLGLLADDGRRSFFFSTNFQHPPPCKLHCTERLHSRSAMGPLFVDKSVEQLILLSAEMLMQGGHSEFDL